MVIIIIFFWGTLIYLFLAETSVKMSPNPLIDHCIERSQEILKERSILNPNKSTKKRKNRQKNFLFVKKIFFAVKKKETPLLKVVLQKRMQFANSQTKNQDIFSRTITSKLIFLFLFFGFFL